jgi:hypothetical protein
MYGIIDRSPTQQSAGKAVFTGVLSYCDGAAFNCGGAVFILIAKGLQTTPRLLVYRTHGQKIALPSVSSRRYRCLGLCFISSTIP